MSALKFFVFKSDQTLMHEISLLYSANSLTHPIDSNWPPQLWGAEPRRRDHAYQDLRL